MTSGLTWCMPEVWRAEKKCKSFLRCSGEQSFDCSPNPSIQVKRSSTMHSWKHQWMLNYSKNYNNWDYFTVWPAQQILLNNSKAQHLWHQLCFICIALCVCLCSKSTTIEKEINSDLLCQEVLKFMVLSFSWWMQSSWSQGCDFNPLEPKLIFKDLTEYLDPDNLKHDRFLPFNIFISCITHCNPLIVTVYFECNL